MRPKFSLVVGALVLVAFGGVSAALTFAQGAAPLGSPSIAVALEQDADVFSVWWKGYNAPPGATVNLSLVPVPDGPWITLATDEPVIGDGSWQVVPDDCTGDRCGHPVAGNYIVRVWIVAATRWVASADTGQLIIEE